MSSPGRTLRRARHLRGSMTPPEVVLWQALRGRRLEELRFRRQHPFDPWILDFFCPSARLAVEVDGECHGFGDPGWDARRDADLGRRGVRVLRFAAVDVLREIDGVVATIAEAAHAPGLPPG